VWQTDTLPYQRPRYATRRASNKKLSWCWQRARRLLADVLGIPGFQTKSTPFCSASFSLTVGAASIFVTCPYSEDEPLSKLLPSSVSVSCVLRFFWGVLFSRRRVPCASVSPSMASFYFVFLAKTLFASSGSLSEIDSPVHYRSLLRCRGLAAWPGECSLIGWFRSAFDARSVRNGFRVPKEGVQKCPPNFAKCEPIVMKFCTMVDEALGCL